MRQEEINELACANQRRAEAVLAESKFVDIWTAAGCRVNVVGSLCMGLLVCHRDIDLHVYSRGVTTAESFAIVAKIAENPNVTEIKCINGLHTDERCIAWHIYYLYEGEIWQVDVIHIEAGTEYDGFFENMADRIVAVMTVDQRDTIIRLKYETPADKDYHGVEYYEAVIADGIKSLPELDRWIEEHRKRPSYYWIP